MGNRRVHPCRGSKLETQLVVLRVPAALAFILLAMDVATAEIGIEAVAAERFLLRLATTLAQTRAAPTEHPDRQSQFFGILEQTASTVQPYPDVAVGVDEGHGFVRHWFMVWVHRWFDRFGVFAVAAASRTT